MENRDLKGAPGFMCRKRILVAALAASAFVSFGACSSRYSDVSDRSGWPAERAAVDERLRSHLSNGRFDKAAELADSMLSAGWSDPRLLGQKAVAIGALGGTEEAISLFEEAIVEDYAGCENHLNFAVLLMRAGKSGRAITELNEAKQFCGGVNRMLIYRNLAVGYIETAQPGKAIDEAEAGLAIDPHDPYLLGLKGMLISESAPALAESLLAIPIGSGAAEPEFLYRYGVLLLNAGRPGPAAEILAEASQRRPFDPAIREAMASALNRSGRFAEADSLYRVLLGEGRDVSLHLARTLMDLNRYREALELLSSLEPTAEVLDRSAMCLFRLGELDEALAKGREAVSARPDWPVAMINVAVILAAQGELNEARAMLERVLVIEPGNETAAQNLARIRGVLERAK
jgi:Flp pilus assembly protein TadD